MDHLIQFISQALAPGIALSSTIFYSSLLQNRFVYITGRARDLNKEARQLFGEAPVHHQRRLASIRWQVEMLNARTHIVRRSIMVAYGSLVTFTLTILSLFLISVFGWQELSRLPISTFTLGFLILGGALFLSFTEMYMAQQSLIEDIRTSCYPEDEGEPGSWQGHLPGKS